MNVEALERGVELQELINTTTEGLKNLKELREEVQTNDRNDNKYYEDSMYNLTICEHKDGSGMKAVLPRYMGNQELLDIIIDKLQDQLTSFESELKKL